MCTVFVVHRGVVVNFVFEVEQIIKEHPLWSAVARNKLTIQILVEIWVVNGIHVDGVRVPKTRIWDDDGESEQQVYAGA